MKPESRSQILLSITRSKAKMYEYDVPVDQHIDMPRDPARLFNLTIGLLGDFAAQVNSNPPNQEYLKELKDNLRFSARFFDSYLQSRLQQNLDPYLILLGSASYYLCDLPGSSRILAAHLNGSLNLQGLGLEQLLLWLLQWNLSPYSDNPREPYGQFIKNISQYLVQFYRDGKDKDQLSENALQLRRTAYDLGTPRQLLFADVICTIVGKRIENSSWHSLPLYSGIPVEEWASALKKDTFIKELWPAQHLLGEKEVYKGKSAVVQMPTSAGKTKATEIVLRSAFLAGRSSLAVIVAPFRALCHEISNSLQIAFRGESVNVDELSDVFQSDFDIQELLGRKQILVITPEKLVYVLRHNPEIAAHIGLLIYDEGHQFDSGTRGITYELLLTSLKSMVPTGIQTLLISAVIRNAEAIGKWLNNDDFKLALGTNLMPTYRTIAFTSWMDKLGRLDFINPDNPNTTEFFVPRIIDQQKLNLEGRERKERTFPEKNDGQTIALFLGLKLARNGAIAIFCGKKTTAASLCDKVVEAYRRGLSLITPIEFSNKDEVDRLAYLYARNLGDYASATMCAKLGIFTHHGNTPQGIRLAVEHAMKSKKVRFVICTSTLAQGVNLPIRYLIVTSVYQGDEPISVRDFHNLIGRAGRADEHTEGSILFADPEIYDQRGWRWRQIRDLLQPENSEPCTSSLLDIFKPLSGANQEYTINIGISDIVSAYIDNTLDDFIRNIYSAVEKKGLQKDGLEEQITEKIRIISAIENYLMAHWDESKSELADEEITWLATGTLAYFLAEDDQKTKIVDFFLQLAHNIVQNVPDASKRKIYGRTLYGVKTSIKIETWVKQHLEELIACTEHDALLTSIWPVLADNISNNTFRKCEPPLVLYDIALGWTQGKPFDDLFTISCKVDVHLIARTQRRQLRLESIIDICENGLAFDGTLVLAAIIEIAAMVQPHGTEATILRLLGLQKRLKYGLPDANSIAIYELGFADRMVSIELSSILGNVSSDRKSIIRALKRTRARVQEVLNKYPSYFTERFENLL